MERPILRTLDAGRPGDLSFISIIVGNMVEAAAEKMAPIRFCKAAAYITISVKIKKPTYSWKISSGARK